MNLEKLKILDKLADKLESKHIAGSARGDEESKEILAFLQFYRIQRALGYAETRNESEKVCKDKSMKHYCLGCKLLDYCKQFH